MKNFFAVTMLLLASSALAEKCKLGLKYEAYVSDSCTGDAKGYKTYEEADITETDTCTICDCGTEWKKIECFETGPHYIVFSDDECKNEKGRIKYEWETCKDGGRWYTGADVTYTDKYVTSATQPSVTTSATQLSVAASLILGAAASMM